MTNRELEARARQIAEDLRQTQANVNYTLYLAELFEMVAQLAKDVRIASTGMPVGLF